jgi:hypothetical protein
VIATAPLVRSFTSWANLVAAACWVDSSATSWASLSLNSAANAVLAASIATDPTTKPSSFILYLPTMRPPASERLVT